MRMARSDKGITTAEMAAKVGIDRTQVSRWELGQVVPSLAHLIVFADVCEVPLDWFVEAVR